MKQEIININHIKENADNPRCITPEMLDKLINSILVFPKMLDIRPIVVNEESVILGGNMRFKALTAILNLAIEEVTERIKKSQQKGKLTEAEAQNLIDHWTQWRDAPLVGIIRGELTEDEVKQFVIKDNVSAGDWDYDALENFDQEDLADWGVQTWGSIDDYMDYEDSTPAPACAERLRIIITYPRDRVTEVENLLGKEVSKPNFRLEELL